MSRDCIVLFPEFPRLGKTAFYRCKVFLSDPHGVLMQPRLPECFIAEPDERRPHVRIIPLIHRVVSLSLACRNAVFAFQIGQKIA